MKNLKSFLAIPAVYRCFQRFVGANRSRSEYVRSYLKPRAGESILDIGCGPGDFVDFLPNTHYVGLDLSPAYIRAATDRYGSRGRFVCQSITEFTVSEPHSFDLVMANGVLHHLSDAEVCDLFRAAQLALKPGGRFVSLDPCFSPGQSRIALWLIRNDRGQYVRNREEYVSLAQRGFLRVCAHVRHDLLRIPYTHLIMVASNDHQLPSS